MNKNVFVAPGIIIGTLLAIGVAIVIYGSTQSPSSTEPEEKFPRAVWSTAEDYKIESTPDETTITNTDA
ncbi:MAG: hypothetical protein Q8O98_02530, partial [bacterium]|nr:hypothetical protein [bacterium]